MQLTVTHAGKNRPKRRNVFKKGFFYGGEFITKFNNDWVMNLASGLAYNLMVAIVPIAIAVVAVLGFTVGQLDPQAEAELIDHLRNIFPDTVSSTSVLQLALNSLKRSAGLLSIIAILASLFGGSRLFIAIEGYFSIIYRTYPRKVIAQNVMAIMMMLVFIALIPIMVVASSVPALIFSLVQNTGINQLPGIVELVHNGFILSAASIFSSFVVCWILLETIYIAVPNQKISFKNSWKGAIVGALLLQLFLSLFPLYITHFMGSYTGEVGFAVILLLFFYYFAVILLVGAEINAYFSEKIRPLANNIAAVLRDSSHAAEEVAHDEQVAAQQDEQGKHPATSSAHAQVAAQQDENGKQPETASRRADRQSQVEERGGGRSSNGTQTEMTESKRERREGTEHLK